MARKAGRPRQEALSREKILEAALSLIDAHGVEAFSMRRLAAALEVDPMAIYHYLPNKEAILRGLIELIFANLHVPPTENASWEETVRACAHAYYDAVRAHPQLIIYVVGDVDLVMHAALSANNEQLYAALFNAGLDARQVFYAVSLIIDYLHGCLLGESAMQNSDPTSMLQHFEQSTTDQYPAIRRVVEAIQQEPISDVFGFDIGLNIILAGIKTLVK